MSEDSASAPANVSPGDQIAGYRLEEQIGQGGMAVVYRAHDDRLDRRVALKLLAPGLASDTAFRTRFIRESRAAAAVDHPNIIPVYDAGDAGGFLFISMRYVQGGDVRSLIADGQPLPPARAWHIINQVAAALDAAHAHGLVHRDVKPANMLLDTSGRTGGGTRGSSDEPHDHVYLSDFGISKTTVASNLTSTGQFVGTLDYIAPEQIEGQSIDGRTDEYSLACAAFELLSGGPPYRRSLGLALINAHLAEAPPSLVARRPELPPAVDLVLAKAMAKDPAQRYATCVQFATDLGRALGLAAGPIEAGAAPTAAQGAGPAPNRPWPATELVSGAAAAAAAGAAGAALGATAADQASGPGQAAAAAHTPPGGTGTPQPGTGVPAAPGMFDPSTMLAGQQGSPSGPGGQAPNGPGGIGPGGQPPTGGPGGQVPPPTVARGQGGQPWPGQYAPGQTPPPQYAPGQTPPPQQYAPGQTPPPQQQPGSWQTGGQPGAQGNYQTYQQPQQYQPYQTGPVGPVQPGWQPPYEGGPGGPTGPNWPGQPQQPRQPKRSRGILIGSVIATVAIVLAAAAVVYFVVLKKNTTNNNANGPTSSSSAPSTSPPPTSASVSPTAPTAQSQASGINNLLVSSAQSRSQWNSNVLTSDVGACVNLNSDVTQIGDIASERMNELNQAKALQVSAISNGAVLKSQLIAALQISYRIDNDYLQWAEQQQSSNCGVGTNSAYYDDASNMNSQATADKTTFLNTWDPIASQYGYQQFQAGQI